MAFRSVALNRQDVTWRFPNHKGGEILVLVFPGLLGMDSLSASPSSEFGWLPADPASEDQRKVMFVPKAGRCKAL